MMPPPLSLGAMCFSCGETEPTMGRRIKDALAQLSDVLVRLTALMDKDTEPRVATGRPGAAGGASGPAPSRPGISELYPTSSHQSCYQAGGP